MIHIYIHIYVVVCWRCWLNRVGSWFWVFWIYSLCIKRTSTGLGNPLKMITLWAMTKSLLLNMAIEIVDLPIKHGDFP